MLVERVKNLASSSLVEICVESFRKFLKIFLLERKYSQQNLNSVEKYIKAIIPASLHELVQRMLEFKILSSYETEELIGSAFYIYNRIRLASSFGEESTNIIYNQKNAKDLDSLNFSKYKECTVDVRSGDPDCEEDLPKQTALHCMTNNICTMTNVVALNLVFCNTEMFKIISKSCYCLEEFIVFSLECCVADLIWFCGFNPAEVTKYNQVKGLTHLSKSVCKNLKLLKIPLTPWDHSEAVAIILTTFSKLEDLNLILDFYAPVIAFQLIYGYNETRYPDITNFLSLRKFRCSMVLSPSELALVVKTCPQLSSVCLCCSNTARCDQNLLAELLPIKNLLSLDLTKANMDAFRWFLNQKGKSITSLFYMYELRDSSTPSLVEFIAQMCPKLENLHLEGEFRTSDWEDGLQVSDHFPSYSLLPLKTLMIKSEFDTADATSLVHYLIWLLSPSQLEEVKFKSIFPRWLSDDDCQRLFESPFFKRAKMFSHYGLIRGVNETIKLLEAAPFLENPQILCHNGEYEYYEQFLPMHVGNYVIRDV